jgi:hypothetical protein
MTLIPDDAKTRNKDLRRWKRRKWLKHGGFSIMVTVVSFIVPISCVSFNGGFS